MAGSIYKIFIFKIFILNVYMNEKFALLFIVISDLKLKLKATSFLGVLL